MAVGTAAGISLSSILSTIGGIIEAISVSLDIAQQQCEMISLKEYYKYKIEGNKKMYEIYPAIAVAERISAVAVSNSSSAYELKTKIFRQGIVIKTEDTGEYYYIGGISPVWIGGSNIAVYQGGAAFRGSVKLPAKARDIFISNGGIGIIPLKRVSAQIEWYNPARFKSCQGLLGTIWDYITTIGVASVVTIASLASEITLSSPRSIDDLVYPGSGGSYYVSKTLIGSSLGGERSDELRTTSD
ncbi:MAG: hypothetical protein QXY87_03980 [Saccharolobus sp.]|uniref:hypothetical protein n=1 Tax=Saccharolobus TaxID=2100760 RepID=UPI001F100F21|nr:hypothetical protein [Saccharolobus shibatae]MCH4814960.1 hypothetical protein [Saccharolobus shibatae]